MEAGHSELRLSDPALLLPVSTSGGSTPALTQTEQPLLLSQQGEN